MANRKIFVTDLLDELNNIAEFSLAEDWDNIGLMVGDPEQQITGTLVALDVTPEVIEEASANELNTIVAHHPLIFKPLKSISAENAIGRCLQQAIKKGISIIGCHTNLDVASQGVNDILAAKLGIAEARPLTIKSHAEPQNRVGFGRIGKLENPVEFKAFAHKTMKQLGLKALRIAGALPQTITTVAVCGGSGSDLAPIAQAMGADIYITGEIKHSMARWAEESDFCLVDAGHYATENVIVPHLAGLLRDTFRNKGVMLKVLETKLLHDPFTNFIDMNDMILQL